jgi:Cu-Zn family superoxide dismutase
MVLAGGIGQPPAPIQRKEIQMLDLIARPLSVIVLAVVAGVACSTAASFTTDEPSDVIVAHAMLTDSAGARIGVAEFREDRAGTVHVDLSVVSTTPGLHGIHVHSVGSCSGVAFGGAGGHFNPSAAHHALSNASGPHAGDLPNLDVLSNGVGRYQGVTTRVTLSPGRTSLLDADGSALVIHAGRDDQLTDPSGNSGARVGCGVIVRDAA